MSIAWRALDAALHILAGPGTQRERLYDATHGTLIYLRKKELPQEIHDDYTLFRSCLGTAAHDHALLRETIAALDDSTVEAAIDAVIRMHDAVTRYQPIPRSVRQLTPPGRV